MSSRYPQKTYQQGRETEPHKQEAALMASNHTMGTPGIRGIEAVEAQYRVLPPYPQNSSKSTWAIAR